MAGIPYVTRLPDGQYLAVELPEGSAIKDAETGEILLRPAAMRLLDRLRTLLSPVPPSPTAGRLRILFEALNVPRDQLALQMGVEPATLQAWETGDVTPSLDEVRKLESIRLAAARHGVLVPERIAG